MNSIHPKVAEILKKFNGRRYEPVAYRGMGIAHDMYALGTPDGGLQGPQGVRPNLYTYQQASKLADQLNQIRAAFLIAELEAAKAEVAA
jgi:hypothetical protein